ncbi:MAG: tetratricopeptide repeat protein [Saprospiraceae bacterium]|nr:tetratricopeptide repeat protein [Saprospiraceae bacterium]
MKSRKKNKSVNINIPTVTQNTKWDLKFILPIITLSIITFVSFQGALDNKFVNWDDQVYVEEQPLVLNRDYSQLLKSPVSLNYHPITMISLALQVPKDVKKLSPAPFIKLNVWIHIFNGVLVFLLIWMIQEKKWLVALLTSLIFALHPAHTESVVWISERKDVLYTFFLLLSCITYWQYLKTNKNRWIWIAGVLFILSILSKAMAVIIPLIWILLDYWKGSKVSDINIWVKKIPFFAISIFFGLLAVSVQSGGDFGGILTLYGEKAKAVADANIFTVWQRFQFATYGFVNYILMFFNPNKICAFYPYPPGDKLPGVSGIMYPLSFITILVGTVLSMSKTKIVAFGIGFYFVTIVLVLQFMSVGLAIMADRYTYVPYIGLAFIFIYIAEKWVATLSQPYKYGMLSVGIVFIIFLAIKTKSQVDVWQDSESLWTQTLKYYPNEDLALANRGNYRGKTGNITGALQDFQLAISDGCKRSDIYEGLGNSYGTLSDQQPEKKQELVNKAIEMYQKALELDPNKGNIHYNLGVAQLQSNPSASVAAFSAALKLMPYKENEILPVLGLSQLNSGSYSDAVSTLTKGINAGIKTDAIFYHRGLAFLGMSDKNKAESDFRQALLLNPANTDVQTRLQAIDNK